MKPEERLTLLFLSREATVLEVFASSWQLLQRPVCLASSLLAVGGYGQEAHLAGVHCGGMERSCTPPLQQWLWLSSGASWLILHLARGRHSSFLGGLVLGRGFGSHFWKLRLESVFSDFAFFLASHFIAYHKNACVT